MSAPVVSLAIPTAAGWIPERAQSLERLRTAIAPGKPHRVCEFTSKCHFTQWATEMWQWMEDTPADWALTLQDDVITAPRFWDKLRAMLTAVPDTVDIICLESAHPSTPLLHAADEPWYTVSDMLIGTAYLVRPRALAASRMWRENRLREGAWFPGPQCVTEDTLLGLFAMTTRRRIWCPTVTIVDHDLSVPSTCGNDAHANRRPRVRWDNCGYKDDVLEQVSYWRPRSKYSYELNKTMPYAPHLGLGYGGGVPALAKRWVTGLSDDDLLEFSGDTGREGIWNTIALAMTMDKDIPVCVICGKNPVAAKGDSGLGVCPGCVGASAKAMLDNVRVA